MSQRLAMRTMSLTRDFSAIRTLADQAFSRAAGAPLVAGNLVCVMRDAVENYPAWERAMREARSTIHIEMYIVHRDHVGRRFIDLLAAKAREGVKVRFLYDWFGCGWSPLLGLFRPLVEAGGELRPFNPPTITAVLGWVRRNHRKLITVDGRTAFVSGLCIGRMWEGDDGRPPWRDTGVEIEGPAVAFAERAFADSWRLAGGTIDDAALPDPEQVPAAGDVSLRLIPTEPFTASMLRVDLLVSSLARQRLWITDAYFVGHGLYVDALRRAANDGVDVRLLLPQGSDVGMTVSASRTMYRSLLESGVRIFEWNGSMIHAKTAVADSRWARIGSTNLNLLSWLGLWELDVAIEDNRIATTLEAHYVQDLETSTEIVLTSPYRYEARNRPRLPARARARRSARRVVRTMTGIGRSIGAAVTGNRPLEDFEFAPALGFGLVLTFFGAITFWHPIMLAWPLAALAVWTGLSLMAESLTLWRRKQK